MKKEQYIRAMRIIKKISYPIIIVLIIISAYNFGKINGLINGFAIVQGFNNETLCDLFNERTNKTFYEDDEGYCIMAEKEYDVKMDCSFGKFRIKGNRTMNNIERLAFLPEKIVFYPLLRCWY